MAKATRRTELALTDIGKTGRAGADQTERGQRGGFGTPQAHEADQEIQVQKAGGGQVGRGPNTSRTAEPATNTELPENCIWQPRALY